MSLQLLEENWNKIVQKVVKPLWHTKFKGMYTKAKLDYHDFLSLANEEIVKAMKNFNPSKSNIFTYSSTVLNKKAMTELRDWTTRDRRATLAMSASLNECLSLEAKVEYGDTLTSKEQGDNSSISKTKKYIQSLSWVQKEILLLRCLGFDEFDIIEIMDIGMEEYKENLKKIQSRRKVSKLRNGVD